MSELTGNLTALGVRPGDVLHVRTSTLYGWAIRRALPGSWGNHDAIITWSELRGWAVAEMLGNGFALTPYAQYLAEIASGKCGVVFLRPRGMTVDESIRVSDRALALAADPLRYDWLAIAGHAWGVLFRTAGGTWDREWKWYCTELVAHLYGSVGRNAWEKRLPTPLTTEKRIAAGKFAIVSEQGIGKYRWSDWIGKCQKVEVQESCWQPA